MDWIQAIYETLASFFNGVLSVLSYIRNILQTIWFSMTTLLTAVYELVGQIFTSGLF